MIADAWTEERTASGFRCSFDVGWPGGRERVFFEAEIPPALLGGGASLRPPRGDLAVATCLLPAMSLGLPLAIPTLSMPEMTDRLDRLQARFATWHRTLEPVPIEERGDAPGPPPPGGRGGAAFFSGGVDSWFTVLEELSAIDFLIAVHGFDVSLDAVGQWEEVRRHLARAAAEIERPLVRVRTNVRTLGDRFVDWPTYHGAALAAVAALLAPLAATFYVASTFHREAVLAWGSHPDTDPLWSGRDHRIVHHGCDHTRTAKTARIAGEAPVRRSLRVCWENPGGAYNCGRCQKCVRTMLALTLAGKLEEAETFGPVDLRRLARRLRFGTPSERIFLEELISAFEMGEPHSPLLADLRRARRAESLRSASRGMRDRIRQAGRHIGNVLGQRSSRT